MRINVKALALTFGLGWGLGLFFLTWWSIALNGPNADPTFIGRNLYPGFSLTPLGSLAGLAWGLVDGFIIGAILGWLYNRLSGKQAA